MIFFEQISLSGAKIIIRHTFLTIITLVGFSVVSNSSEMYPNLDFSSTFDWGEVLVGETTGFVTQTESFGYVPGLISLASDGGMLPLTPYIGYGSVQNCGIGTDMEIICNIYTEFKPTSIGHFDFIWSNYQIPVYDVGIITQGSYTVHYTGEGVAPPPVPLPATLPLLLGALGGLGLAGWRKSKAMAV